MKRSLLFALSLLVVVGGVVAADWWIALPPGRTASFVGRQTCAQCHAQQVARWTGSDHDLAMEVATAESVLGDFNDCKFEHLGVKSRFFRKDGGFFVTTEGPTGKEQTFPIKYTFGVRPLQQYLIEFSDGRVQALSVAWDTVKRRWFDLHPDERIAPDDWLHWTKAGQNWNYMCAECHSTDLKKSYDAKTDSYHTTFSEIDVSCEDCHGPGSIHVELANSKSLFWDRRYGYGLAELKGHPAKNELDVCARCHSRRRIVHGDFQAGKEFLDYYEPELLDGELYYPDGQIRDEDYEYGSFLQSRMHREGVRCTDCHDPHSSQVRLPENQLCTRCHTAGKYDAPSHHHHQVGSKGALCVECHMPVRHYMVVDPRRDHSLRVPRPDLTLKIGTPNACQACHQDKTPKWAADAVVAWYGPKRAQDPHYGEAIAAGRAAEPSGERPLIELAKNKKFLDKAHQVGAIVRASAVALLGRYATSEAREAIERALNDAEPLVRTAAIRQIDQDRSLDEAAAERLRRLLVPLLDDPIRLVRTEAARVLSAVPMATLGRPERERFDVVIAEWRGGLAETADDAGAHLAMGLVDANLHQSDSARREYQTAIHLHPNPLQAVQARVQLAMLEHEAGDDSHAERLYREVIEIEPKWEQGHFSLGLLLAENEKRLPEAAESLGVAAGLAPTNARMQYNYGLALQKLGKMQEAEHYLAAAQKLAPTSVEFLYALVVFYAQERKWQQALSYGERLAQLDPRMRSLLAEILQQSRQPKVIGPEAK